ncbi:MAG: hypothetical protein ABL914_06775 [Novosphingobium sp.]|uniref:hypothetical protein n=1 Tax=Novosphingobium sp. TaxID=1874826 RepID=UPI0032B9503F
MDWQADISHWLTADWVRYLLLPGIAALILSIIGWRKERARKNRTNPDAVPLLPWRDISFWASFAAILLLIAAGYSALTS